jgi:hypothetical protein
MLQSYFSSHIILPKDKSIFLPMHVLCFQKVQKKQNKTKQKKATCFDFWLDLKKIMIKTNTSWTPLDIYTPNKYWWNDILQRKEKICLLGFLH